MARRAAVALFLAAASTTLAWGCAGRPVGPANAPVAPVLGPVDVTGVSRDADVIFLDPDTKPASGFGFLVVRFGGGAAGAQRQAQSFPSTTTRFELEVTAPDIVEPVTASVVKPQAGATASVNLVVPVGTNRSLKVDARNALGRTVATTTVTGLSVSTGVYTPVTAGLAATVGDITGSVVDQITGLPVANVIVTASWSGGISVLTDSAGNFRLPDVATGTFLVDFSRTSYDSSQQQVTITAGATANAVPQQLAFKHWTQQISGTSADLYGVLARSATEAFAWGSGGTLIHTADGGQTWSKVVTQAQGNVTGLGFASASTGYFVTDGGIFPGLYKTTDGGASWTSVNDTVRGSGLLVLDAQTIWIWDNRHISGITSDLVRSANSGGSFSTLGTQGQTLWDYSRVSDAVVWAVRRSDESRVRKSTSGGTAWADTTALPLTVPGAAAGAEMYASDVNTCRAVGRKSLSDGRHPAVATTVDGGATWQLSYSGPSRRAAYRIYNEDPDDEFRAIVPFGTGWCAVGTYGAVAMQYSLDGTWNTQSIQPADLRAYMLNSASFYGTATGWAVGNGGKILKY